MPHVLATVAVGLPARSRRCIADRGGRRLEPGAAPLGEHGVLLVGLYPEDGPYFEVHHTHADTFDKIDPDEARAGLAAVAGLLWQLANEPLEMP